MFLCMYICFHHEAITKLNTITQLNNNSRLNPCMMYAREFCGRSELSTAVYREACRVSCLGSRV